MAVRDGAVGGDVQRNQEALRDNQGQTFFHMSEMTKADQVSGGLSGNDQNFHQA